jgi:hypothetical protein
MAIPFQVFDYEDHSRPGYVWCVRCEDWIPFELASSAGGVDPHVYDHVQVYYALRRQS